MAKDAIKEMILLKKGKKMINTILFDLDGTLLPMDQGEFMDSYLFHMANHLTKANKNPKKVIQDLFIGTEAMIKNNGTMTNEERFFQTFFRQGHEKDMIKVFEAFYEKSFDHVRQATKPKAEAASIVHHLKMKGYRLILATNPIFPAIATNKRIEWAGLKQADFDLITTMENAGYCKPNLEYFKYILNKTGVDASQCMMVGNDRLEDMCAKNLGILTYLLDDCAISKGEQDIEPDFKGNFNQLIAFVEGLPTIP